MSSDSGTGSARTPSLNPPYFEVREVYGGDWRTCARFRLRSDANRYVERRAGDGPFLIYGPDGNLLTTHAHATEVPRVRRGADTVPTMKCVRRDEDP